ncbi:MAG: DivIVA domain-containing protein [Clostridia bacterium]|nr:DivIVA domain-containing protein [Clostridia bacterium]
MLTPQEIQNKKFEKAVFGGYDMSQIDDFLDVVLADYSDLYKENATLKAKMRVLVEKIDEYRAVDEQMRKALYSAQVSAEKTLEEARAEADRIIENARAEADRRCGDIEIRIVEEQQRLVRMQGETASYAAKIKQLLNRNIEVLDAIATAPVEPVAPIKVQEEPAEQPVEEPAAIEQEEPIFEEPKSRAAEDTVDEIAALLLAEERQAPQEDDGPEIMAAVEFGDTRVIDLGGKADELFARRTSKDDESDTAKIYGDNAHTPKPRFNFTDLRFGKDYQDDEN